MAGIQNHYHLGDRLWPVLSLGGRSFVNPAFDVQFIWLHGNEVYYGFTPDYGFPELNVFDAEADARGECERRNRSVNPRAPAKGAKP